MNATYVLLHLMVEGVPRGAIGVGADERLAVRHGEAGRLMELLG
jgi:hypothetical protein